jgi:hypothetical protein
VPDQVFHPYTAWEDWQAGMWQSPTDVTADMERAVHILSSPSVFLSAARAMLRDWPNAAEHNLTDMAQNRRAWVGQATCMHLAQVPEEATRQAWWTLTVAEQYTANQVADQAIAEWRHERETAESPVLFVIERRGNVA